MYSWISPAAYLARQRNRIIRLEDTKMRLSRLVGQVYDRMDLRIYFFRPLFRQLYAIARCLVSDLADRAFCYILRLDWIDEIDYHWSSLCEDISSLLKRERIRPLIRFADVCGRWLMNRRASWQDACEMVDQGVYTSRQLDRYRAGRRINYLQCRSIQQPHDK